MPIIHHVQAIPLFVTSTSIPLFVAILRVTRTPEGNEMSAEETTKYALPFEHLSCLYTGLNDVAYQIYILRHVLANNHASAGRLHTLERAQQN
jgi:hypothetical protein